MTEKPYVPTDGEVRFAYIDRKGFEAQIRAGFADVDDAAAEAEYARWLRAHDERVLRDAGIADRWEYGTLCGLAECTHPHAWRPGDDPPLPEEQLMRRRAAQEIAPGEWEPATHIEEER